MSTMHHYPGKNRQPKSDAPQNNIQINLRVSSVFLHVVDEWRRKQPDLPNRTAAIRRLIIEATRK